MYLKIITELFERNICKYMVSISLVVHKYEEQLKIVIFPQQPVLQNISLKRQSKQLSEVVNIW